MLDEREPVRLAKWPFYLADVVLSGVVFFVLYQMGTFEGTTEMVIVGFCLGVAAIAAWISVLPWLKEHDAAVQLTESSNLKSSLEQIKGVEKVADLIRQSNVQWQAIQDASGRTVASAREITEQMKVEAEEFVRFMGRAHDQERAGLRLEVEKLRRREGDWIKVTVGMLDHTYAIFRAAARSGQQGLIAQLSQFQNACRDVARRMGLAPFLPMVGENFDSRAHQLPDSVVAATEGAKIQEVLASGFTYQGQLLRRALVLVEGSGMAASAEVVAEGGHKPPLQEGVEGLTGEGEPMRVADETAPGSTAADESSGGEAMGAGVEVFEDVGEAERGAGRVMGNLPETSWDEAGEASAGESAASERGSEKKSPQDELPF